MSATPENTQPTPDAAAELEGRQTDPQTEKKAAPATPGAIPSSTQSNMGSGAGIRGDYGDASQTNGLEGGPDSAPDGSPKTE